MIIRNLFNYLTKYCQETNTNKYKTTNSNINFNFVSGDILQYTGYSANLKSVATNSPTSDITVTFNFIASIPSVTTNAATTITNYTAICGGNVTSDGGEIVTARGICYATTANPTIANNIVSGGSGTGIFTANLSGLTPGTTYYVRAYATNSVGTAYGNEVSFTTLNLVCGQPFTDLRDSSIYNTIPIGTQCWMAENLKYLPNVVGQNTNSSIIPYYYVYDNNSTNLIIAKTNYNYYTYGVLYNWTAIQQSGSQSICPSGWHVPNNNEWTELIDYLGGENVSGGKLKEIDTIHWNSPNVGATNTSGFKALPGGYHNGLFSQLGYNGVWWSLTSNINPQNPGFRQLNYNSNFIYGNLTNYYQHAFSVRCIRNINVQANIPTVSTISTTQISSTSAYSGGLISHDGGVHVTARGVCWSTTNNPDILLSPKTIDGIDSGSFTSIISGLNPNTTYYLRAYATNSVGTAYGNEIIFTTSTIPANSMHDIDGNVYDTVHIGTQVWMKQNLKTTHYNIGTAIPNVTVNSAWAALSTGAYCDYQNNIGLVGIYGRIYNWYAVNTGNLCPTGWHVPTKTDWIELTNYLGGESIAGGKLKATTLWASPNTGATNETGFTALPGGVRTNNGTFENYGSCNFWSSTEKETTFAWLSWLTYNNSNLYVGYTNKISGRYVRCLRDIAVQANLPVLTTTIANSTTAITGISGGNISTDGGAAVTVRGVCWSISPNPHIGLSTKTIDGSGAGSFTSSIIGLSPNTTYYVRAYATNSIGTSYGNELIFTTPSLIASKVYDIDGNTYDTIQIGYQIWLKQNLKTTHYKNGAAIAYSDCLGNTAGSYCDYYKDTSYNSSTIYGRLYDWYTVNTDSLCPIGWHVPSDQEWSALVTYLGNDSTSGGKLKATTLWNSPNTGATNETGFTALPGGQRNSYCTNSLLGSYGYWWSSTDDSGSNGWYRSLPYDNSKINRNKYPKSYYYSIRCIKDSFSLAYLPSVTTITASSIASTTANSGGNITSIGGAAVTARGVCWSTTTNPTVALSTKTSDGTGIGSFISNITGLTAGTTYYIRAYAINSLGTAYGNEVNFTSIAIIPSLTTTAISNITSTTANLGGDITSSGGEYVTSRGVCWSTSANPTIALSTKTNNGAGTGSFTSNITGLSAGTTYYVRAYATNNIGTAYGNELSFTTTTQPTSVIDYDGNGYDTIHIGTQIWMKQNLKTTHYKNGATIIYPYYPADWSTSTTGAYAWYNNEEATNKNIYGALYNWFAVNTGNLCPTGWHVPSNAEWTTLLTYLGGDSIAGGKLKAINFWQSPNTGATNSSNFSALPCGYISEFADFNDLNFNGYWWSSTAFDNSFSIGRYISYNSNVVNTISIKKRYGYSVRCIKD